MKIEDYDNKKPIEQIILNGKIGYVPTYDDNDTTIGIFNIVEKVTFGGKLIVEQNDGFAFTKDMKDKIEWGRYFANIRFFISDDKIDPTKVDEILIQQLYGETRTQYYHRYSELSGYLWTEEDFKVGGHDIPKILSSYIDKYIHMEIDLFKN